MSFVCKRFIVSTAIAFALATLAIPLPAQPQAAAAQDPLARFPVAHEHNADWCLGYLYIYPDSISYEVTWPATAKSHSFKINRTDVKQIGRWVRSGQQLKAIELKTAKASYDLWWLANEQDVINGRPYQFNPPDAGDPDFLIAAIRDPTTLTSGNAPAASPPPAPVTGSPGLQGIPPSPFAGLQPAQPGAPYPQTQAPNGAGAPQLQQIPASPLAGSLQGQPAVTGPAQPYGAAPYGPYGGGAAPGGTVAPAYSAAGETRFAVVHLHTASQCSGYLYVSQAGVRYEEMQPASDKKHSFSLSRSEITAVQPWVFAGTPMNAAEIRTAHGNYHLWLLPDGANVANTPSNQWNIRNVLPVGPLVAALQGQR